ncbi:MAG: hypothetical protein NTY31_02620 [Candidatus Falkowbacteria bacterium]|nr:hypothetical protein [Candidatus Falkowbacteria bacterium]
MILYHIVHISEGLAEGDENLATIISSWMKDHEEEFRFCTTEDDFHKMTNQVKKNADRVIDPEIQTGEGSGTNLNEHLLSIADLIPNKKGI